jgi:hypothetical protein
VTCGKALKEFHVVTLAIGARVVAVPVRDLHGKGRATISPFIGAIRASVRVKPVRGKIHNFFRFSRTEGGQGELALQPFSV